MTWRNWLWGGSFIAWFMILAAPMLVLLVPINFAGDQSFNERIIGSVVLISLFLLTASFHNWITVRPGSVRVGFFPLYWRTVDINDIRYVIAVEFQPMRDFAGWGIKGLAKSRNGILLGGNPSRGIMIETHDRRRYVLSFADTEPITRALQVQGVTISDVPLIDQVETNEA